MLENRRATQTCDAASSNSNFEQKGKKRYCIKWFIQSQDNRMESKFRRRRIFKTAGFGNQLPHKTSRPAWWRGPRRLPSSTWRMSTSRGCCGAAAASSSAMWPAGERRVWSRVAVTTAACPQLPGTGDTWRGGGRAHDRAGGPQPDHGRRALLAGGRRDVQ